MLELILILHFTRREIIRLKIILNYCILLVNIQLINVQLNVIIWIDTFTLECFLLILEDINTIIILLKNIILLLEIVLLRIIFTT